MIARASLQSGIPPRPAAHRARPTKPDRLGGVDGLPEHMDYRDEGCSVAPACLQCPLPVCRYELPQRLDGLLREPRNAAIVAAVGQSGDHDGIAQSFGVSRRQLFRILARTRAGRVMPTAPAK